MYLAMYWNLPTSEEIKNDDCKKPVQIILISPFVHVLKIQDVQFPSSSVSYNSLSQQQCVTNHIIDNKLSGYSNLHNISFTVSPTLSRYDMIFHSDYYNISDIFL